MWSVIKSLSYFCSPSLLLHPCVNAHNENSWDPVNSESLNSSPPAQNHYIDVIMDTTASQITSLNIVYWTVYLFIQAQIKESIKAARHWPLCGEFTRDRGIPRTKGQYHGKCFHLMTPSCGGKIADNKVQFCQWKFWSFWYFFTEICSSRFDWWEVIIGLDDGLAPNRWQAII